MQGHKSWMTAGKSIGTCEAVEAETADYYESQSTVDAWLIDRCTTESAIGQPGNYWTKSSILYEDYREWAENRGEFALNSTQFGEQLGRKFHKFRRDGMRYQCLLLKRE
jgi:putative DNA primase/helicase